MAARNQYQRLLSFEQIDGMTPKSVEEAREQIATDEFFAEVEKRSQRRGPRHFPLGEEGGWKYHTSGVVKR